MVGPFDTGQPLPPSKPVQPVQGLSSAAPNVLGPRIPGQDSPKLGGRNDDGSGQLPLQPAWDVGDQGATPPVSAPPDHYGTDAFSQPYEQPAVVAHKSLDGFLKNFRDDVGGFISGIPAAFKVAWKAGSQLSSDPNWVQTIRDNPDALAKELGNTWTTFGPQNTPPINIPSLTGAGVDFDKPMLSIPTSSERPAAPARDAQQTPSQPPSSQQPMSDDELMATMKRIHSDNP